MTKPDDHYKRGVRYMTERLKSPIKVVENRKRRKNLRKAGKAILSHGKPEKFNITVA